MLLLQASRRSADELQLPASDLPRVPEMLSALRMWKTSEASGLRATQAARYTPVKP